MTEVSRFSRPPSFAREPVKSKLQAGLQRKHTLPTTLARLAVSFSSVSTDCSRHINLCVATNATALSCVALLHMSETACGAVQLRSHVT